MNLHDSELTQSKQLKNYKIKPTFLASIFTALSGCTPSAQHIKPETTSLTHYYNKLKPENPDYNWEFIERSYNQ
jgi:hypothetical protein